MAEKKEKLFDMFPPISTEEWMAKINADLKGADFNKKLVWRTNEGFNVMPFYRAEDLEKLSHLGTMPGQFPYVRGTRTNNDWLIRQDIIEGETAAELNAAARHALDRGVDSLGFCVCDKLDAKAIEELLKDIDLKKVEVNFNCCPSNSVAVAKVLVDYLKAKGLENDFRGSVSYNPFRPMLKKGVVPTTCFCETAKELLDVVNDVPHLRCLSVDSYILGNAGAYITQELGYALAWGAQYLTALTDKGLEADAIAKRIKFNMNISSNYFMEIAKFRAGRMLWAEIVKAYEPKAENCCCSKMKVHAVTSQFNQTIYDAHVNLLRSMTETMSAALAGVDSIETLPFDLQYQKPDEFSERIARNQQIMLREESHLNKVVDPAGGSYYIETLTASIADVAWKLFNEVIDNGGFYEELAKGNIQKAVNESGVKRHTDVARRKEILLGTNQYPNFNEFAADKIKKECGCGCGCGCKEEGTVEALNMDRAASQFEALRLQTEHSGKRPKVFMLTIGNLAMRLARAQFSSNFFGCAGYEIIDNLGFETVQAGVDAALEKGAEVVVLCSSDDEYAELASEAFKYLNGRAEFVVAGAPACMEDLKAVGIENFIHVRVNVLETLQGFNAKLLK
ncbi:MAG: methylmalonyl-CoA mutase small subunit [Prevotella sp.]|nr:methylmalonyl-CoA mutase small subunit [Prevotella sp.]MCM1074728.1 methylmalonyl-CoA mutase small subunit [Ruminococcus sp.]